MHLQQQTSYSCFCYGFPCILYDSLKYPHDQRTCVEPVPQVLPPLRSLRWRARSGVRRGRREALTAQSRWRRGGEPGGD